MDVDYSILPAVVSTGSAAASKTAVHDQAPNNVCYTWGHGDEAGVKAAFEKAHHIRDRKSVV